MKMLFDVYNPYTNTEVTHYYVELITKSLYVIGIETRHVTRLNAKKNKKVKGVVVVAITDAILAKLRGYKYVILWIQGALPEESYVRNNSKVRLYILNWIEKRAIRYSDFILLVTNEMMSHIKRKHGIAIKNAYVMPCVNEELHESSFETTEKYINNSFVYVGGLQKWQCFEEIVNVYACIEEKVKDTKLYVFTKQIQEAERVIKEVGVKNVEIGYVPQEELSSRIKNIKFGFVIREDIVVNNVATPTKLSNYLANGIIPIYSEAIKEFSHIMKNRKYQILLKNDMNCKAMAETVINSDLLKSLEASSILQEYRELFALYYSKDLHLTEIGKKMKNTFQKMEGDGINR